MSKTITLPTVDQGGWKHSRKDNWWLIPLTQAIVLIVFIIYSLWIILIDDIKYIKVEGTNYISPFFSPELEVSWWPSFLSPALILIWIPLGFRGTCYYARKVYHRAFLADPPACAVSERRKVDHHYKGENSFPFILSNLHRYFFYLAFILAIVHVYDFYLATQFDDGFGIGIGTILLGLDALFLFLYVLSCHSSKHLFGGRLNNFSSINFNFKAWTFIKKLNEKHHVYFWLSLITIMIADIYIRLMSRGIIDDWRLI